MYFMTTSHTDVTSNPSDVSGGILGEHASWRAELTRILWYGLSGTVKYRR